MSKRTIITPESKKNPFVEISENQPQAERSPEDNRKAIQRSLDRKKLVTVADQIAQSSFYFRNYKYQKADQLYPKMLDAALRFVDKCYPHAEGGLLLVDEPKTDAGFQSCLKKQESLRKAGIRHIVVWAKKEDGIGEKNPEEIFFECHQQLIEGEKIYVAYSKAGSKN